MDNIYKGLIGVVVVILVILALPAFGVDLSQIKLWQTGTDTGDTASQGEALTDSEHTTTPTGGAGTGTQIYAISSININSTVSAKLWETTHSINPTMYIWQEGQIEPATVTVSGGNGGAAITPNQKITWAAGTDGTYYWDKGTVNVGWKDNWFNIKLYTVAKGAGNVSITIYKDFTDITDGASNASVGAGETANLKMKIDVTGEYTAIRNPYICMNYNSTIVKTVKISGLLEEGSIPTRLISGLDQCFDTGIEFFTDSDPQLSYDIQVQHISAQDPVANSTSTDPAMTNSTNSNIDWYIIDQDMYYKNGKMYFTNPIDMTNMGSTTEYTAETWFQ